MRNHPIAGLLLVALTLTACGQGAAALSSPTQTLSPVINEPLESKDPAYGAVANECLNCHMDKQRLIDTAKPEEQVVKESTGTG